MLNATRTVQTLQLSLRVWGQKSNMGLSENVVYPYTQWLMIIIPTKWLFHWEYTQHFQTYPYPNNKEIDSGCSSSMGFPRLAIPIPIPPRVVPRLPKHGFHLGVANACVFDSILVKMPWKRALVSKCWNKTSDVTLFCASSNQSDLGANQVHLQLKKCNPPAKGIPPTTSGQFVATNLIYQVRKKKNMSISGHQSALISINPHESPWFLGKL